LNLAAELIILAAEKKLMPIYMDIHSVPGVRSKDVADAHRQDLLHQEEFGCTCMTYWIDENRESIFCLIEAENKDAVKSLHKNTHGLVPHKIIEVSTAVVESFLGRIYDPDDASVENGVKVFTDPGYRLLLVTSTEDHALLQHRHGSKRAEELLHNLNQTVRKNIRMHEGSEAEHEGEGFVVSFVSAAAAISCALDIRKDLPAAEAKKLDFRMALNGGEPIEKSNTLFGDTMQMGNYLCSITSPEKIAIAGKLKELVSRETLQSKKNQLLSLALPDEDFISALFSKLEKYFDDPEFDIPEYAQSMSMSQPQLYRKTTSLTGMSANNLLKAFRLRKALDMIRTRRYSISQVTFETGFSSASYFTKCFKAMYGLLPMEYTELLKHTA
jgi:AraC-like DNA-binding protein